MATTLALVVSGTLVILVAGRFLGNNAEVLIEAMHVPAWMVGWCLGFVTSIPELTASSNSTAAANREGNSTSSTTLRPAWMRW